MTRGLAALTGLTAALALLVLGDWEVGVFVLWCVFAVALLGPSERDDAWQRNHGTRR